ncbi:ferrous iron transport protein A [Cyclobacterium lianum]|uniref:Ferrous iron transport protein A n=1 Tax=Cyclobacterium lianum TaxID=388280 RepID=A0A1M7P7W7_9BACT|nr:FeoA family protein [Cyclobacterium lianum]SHN12723.1 ferrous iron transport protein A [Cyclobacterium lianum]
MTAAGLDKEHTYEIAGITTSPLMVRMMEMGVMPGKTISLLRKAPFKGPMAFLIQGNVLALRIEEADLIQIKEV